MTTLKVPEMHCNNCVSRITKALTAADLYAVKRPAKTEAPADDQNQKEA
ncbi:MAG: copper chaperone [Coriobacteriaceae bacterium]|nr:copper chaperone [Coriobacteriaceae bacterium]